MHAPCLVESPPEFERDLDALGNADRKAVAAAVDDLTSDPERGVLKRDRTQRLYRQLAIDGEVIATGPVEVEEGQATVGLEAHEVRRRLVLQYAVLERERGVFRPRLECRLQLLAVWDGGGALPPHRRP